MVPLLMYWSEHHPIHISRCLLSIKDPFCIIIHVYDHLARDAIVNHHAKIVMDLTMCNSQGCDFATSFV